jgi:hypothetical protein
VTQISLSITERKTKKRKTQIYALAISAKPRNQQFGGVISAAIRRVQTGGSSSTAKITGARFNLKNVPKFGVI